MKIETTSSVECRDGQLVQVTHEVTWENNVMTKGPEKVTPLYIPCSTNESRAAECQ